jgi:hypothetical protein
MAERNLTVDHVTIWRWAQLRAGTQPALPPGTANDKSVVACGRNIRPGRRQVDLFV